MGNTQQRDLLAFFKKNPLILIKKPGRVWLIIPSKKERLQP